MAAGDPTLTRSQANDVLTSADNTGTMGKGTPLDHQARDGTWAPPANYMNRSTTDDTKVGNADRYHQSFSRGRAYSARGEHRSAEQAYQAEADTRMAEAIKVAGAMNAAHQPPYDSALADAQYHRTKADAEDQAKQDALDQQLQAARAARGAQQNQAAQSKYEARMERQALAALDSDSEEDRGPSKYQQRKQAAKQNRLKKAAARRQKKAEQSAKSQAAASTADGSESESDAQPAMPGTTSAMAAGTPGSFTALGDGSSASGNTTPRSQHGPDSPRQTGGDSPRLDARDRSGSFSAFDTPNSGGESSGGNGFSALAGASSSPRSQHGSEGPRSRSGSTSSTGSHSPPPLGSVAVAAGNGSDDDSFHTPRSRSGSNTSSTRSHSPPPQGGFHGASSPDASGSHPSPKGGGGGGKSGGGSGRSWCTIM